MTDSRQRTRRTVLKTLGAGVLGGAALTGAATATSAGKDYGRGAGVGAFLNEEALFKDRPIWDSGVADMTGASTVQVSVGTLTSVDVPEELAPDAPDVGPFGYGPRAVKVSPGTEVTWQWVTGHHTVTSLTDAFGSGHGMERGDTWAHTFADTGNYLYYCHPHGTPYPIDAGPLGEVENVFGMRGAVIVADD